MWKFLCEEKPKTNSKYKKPSLIGLMSNYLSIIAESKFVLLYSRSTLTSKKHIIIAQFQIVKLHCNRHP